MQSNNRHDCVAVLFCVVTTTHRAVACSMLCVVQDMEEAMRATLDPEKLAKYSIGGSNVDFDKELGGKVPASGMVSLSAGAKDKEAQPQLYKKDQRKKKFGGSGGKGKQGNAKKRKT